MNYGIVAEFNPFHNGHKYLVDTVKASQGDTVTAVMSESFVQRGECASLPVNYRTEAALRCGVDLVLSLPVPYATASAENFARAGIDVLFGSGVVDTLAFGAESDSLCDFVDCAEFTDSKIFSDVLKSELYNGVSFPRARQLALRKCGKGRCAEVLETPNNILGVEYIKALLSLGYASRSDIENRVHIVKRNGARHDSDDLSSSICSASALRELVRKGDCFAQFMPEESFDVLMRAVSDGKAPADYKRLETAVLYKLRTMSADDFLRIPDVGEGLEYRISKAVRQSASLDEMLEIIKTKRYTHSRLRRIILCALLGITKTDVANRVAYVKVLGFNEKGAELLKKAKSESRLPLCTKRSDFLKLDDAAQKLYALECRSRDIFSLSLPLPDEAGKEMSDKLIVL